MTITRGKFQPHNTFGTMPMQEAWIVGPLCVHKTTHSEWRVSHVASGKNVKVGIKKRRWAISLAKHLSHYPVWGFSTVEEWNNNYKQKAVSSGISTSGMVRFVLGQEKQEKARA